MILESVCPSLVRCAKNSTGLQGLGLVTCDRFPADLLTKTIRDADIWGMSETNFFGRGRQAM